jgi:hypothetical protein
MVLSDGPTTFDGLTRALEAGDIHKVGFTGSSVVGRRIAEVCGRHLVAPTLELGGKNPLVVMPDADLDLAVEGSLFSGFGTAGQRCTSLGVCGRARSDRRRLPRPLHRRGVTRRGRRPDAGRAVRTDDQPALRHQLRRMVRTRPEPPHGDRVDRPGSDHRRQSARRLHRRPGRGDLRAPNDRVRGDQRRRAVPAGDVRADRAGGHLQPPSTRHWRWPTGTATGCPPRSTRPTRSTRSPTGRA